MGNICRSPAAEAVMRKMLNDRGLTDRVSVDSAGTLGYHAGSPSDSRMSQTGTRRGYSFTHLARQVRREDFFDFDYILAMDRENLEDLQRFKPSQGGRAEVSLLLDHCRDLGTCEVPDPYYGGAAGFELVMDLVEAGCAAFLDKLAARHALSG